MLNLVKKIWLKMTDLSLRWQHPLLKYMLLYLWTFMSLLKTFNQLFVMFLLLKPFPAKTLLLLQWGDQRGCRKDASIFRSWLHIQDNREVFIHISKHKGFFAITFSIIFQVDSKEYAVKLAKLQGQCTVSSNSRSVIINST